MRRNEKNAGDARPEANSTRANWLRPLLSAPEAARGHRDRTPALCRLRPRRRSAESCPLAQEPAWLRFCGSRTARCAGFVLSHSSATRANNGPTPQALTATQRTAKSTRDLPGRADSATVRRPAHDGARLPRARRRSSRGRGPDPTDQTAEVRVPRRGEGRKRRSREAVEVDAAQAHRIAAGLAALPPGAGAVRSCEGVSAMAGPEPKVPGLAVIVHVPDS